MEKISKDIVNIIGYHRPERGWETVGDPLQINTACCHIYHRSRAAHSQLKPNLALELGLCVKNALFYFIQPDTNEKLFKFSKFYSNPYDK
jgi:hypothetical protein